MHKATQRRLWADIDSYENVDAPDLLEAHLTAFELSKRRFVRVQEREFLYDRIPNDWAAFARDWIAKQRLYDEGLIRLRALIDLCGLIHDACIYGNIKADDSLDRKLSQARLGTSIQANVTDLWDIVRFRIIVPSLDSLLQLALRFWEIFFDQVLRCRNYYFRPRNLHSNDPYRAIHFELANHQQHMIEVQLMTRRREAVSLLDHAALFKGTLKSMSSVEKQWLLEFSMKANILDVGECANGWFE